MNRFFSLIISVSFLIILQTQSFAGVDVLDDITPAHKRIKLRAVTKGRFFSEGGKLVQFSIDEKHIGTTLSGGDGYAFIQYTPASAGLKTVRVESSGDSSNARLLVTKSGDRVILIAIEESLLKSLFTSTDEKKSGKALMPLSKDFHIVYLSNMLGVKQTGTWLKDRGFPVSIVLHWKGPAFIESLKDKGITPYAIVGTPEILSQAQDIKKRYSFQESEYGERVEDWQDLINKLKK